MEGVIWKWNSAASGHKGINKWLSKVMEALEAASAISEKCAGLPGCTELSQPLQGFQALFLTKAGGSQSFLVVLFVFWAFIGGEIGVNLNCQYPLGGSGS